MKMRVFVWDLPTRLFHWTLVLTFAGLWYSGTQGGEMLQYHIWLGYGMATLLLFRLIWGVLGSQTARFVQFVRGPASMLDYARGQLPEEKIPGHNPMGGMMVMLLLALLIAQVLTGLFAADIDSYAYDGPLVHLVDTVPPDPRRTDIYRKKYARYREWMTKMEDMQHGGESEAEGV